MVWSGILKRWDMTMTPKKPSSSGVQSLALSVFFSRPSPTPSKSISLILLTPYTDIRPAASGRSFPATLLQWPPNPPFPHRVCTKGSSAGLGSKPSTCDCSSDKKLLIPDLCEGCPAPQKQERSAACGRRNNFKSQSLRNKDQILMIYL